MLYVLVCILVYSGRQRKNRQEQRIQEKNNSDEVGSIVFLLIFLVFS